MDSETPTFARRYARPSPQFRQFVVLVVTWTLADWFAKYAWCLRDAEAARCDRTECAVGTFWAHFGVGNR